jgi:ABC-type branched-subunit amino acid transport system substrate-binding protein
MAAPAIRLIKADGGVLGHQLSCVQEDTPGRSGRRGAGRAEDDGDRDIAGRVFGPSSDDALATVPLLKTGHVPRFVDTGQAAL